MVWTVTIDAKDTLTDFVSRHPTPKVSQALSDPVAMTGMPTGKLSRLAASSVKFPIKPPGSTSSNN